MYHLIDVVGHCDVSTLHTIQRSVSTSVLLHQRYDNFALVVIV